MWFYNSTNNDYKKVEWIYLIEQERKEEKWWRELAKIWTDWHTFPRHFYVRFVGVLNKRDERKDWWEMIFAKQIKKKNIEDEMRWDEMLMTRRKKSKERKGEREK